MHSKIVAHAGLAVLAILSLSACAAGAPRLGGDPQLTVVQARELPPPTSSDLTGEGRPYIIGPFDRLKVDVFGIEDLSDREIQVDANGHITFPPVGIVEVAGKTTGEIERLLNDRLGADYVRNPQATVTLKEAVSQVVTIEGQVQRPGIYPVMGNMTLMKAIATAEGTTEFSLLKDVVVFRKVNGQNLAALYDLDAIRHGAYPDPQIYANDIVTIGDNTAKRLFKDILTTFTTVSGPLIIAVDRLGR